MKRYNKYNSNIFTLLVSLVLFIPVLLVFPNMVNAEGRPVKAGVKDVSKPKEGVVSVRAGSEGTWATLHWCERVEEKDEIETGDGGFVEFKLKYNDDLVKIGSNSYLKIIEMKNGEKSKTKKENFTLSKIELKWGMVRVKLDENYDSTMTVITKNTKVKIEKADCIVQYDASLETTTVIVNVAFTNGYALVIPKKSTNKGYGFKVPKKHKIEMVGEKEIFSVDTGGDKLKLFGKEMKFEDEEEGDNNADGKTVTEVTINDKIVVKDLEDKPIIAIIEITKKKGIGEVTLEGSVENDVKCVVIYDLDDGSKNVTVKDDNTWSYSFYPVVGKEYNLTIKEYEDCPKIEKGGRGVSLNMMPIVDDTLRDSKVTKSGFEIDKIEKKIKEEEKPKVDANREARNFVKKFVGYLNSESTSGIRGMVSSSYSGNIGGFGSKSSLLRGLGDYFDNNKSVRLSSSISNASSLDKKGEKIIINARIGGNSVKFWIKKEGSSYRLSYAEGRWFFD